MPKNPYHMKNSLEVSRKKNCELCFEKLQFAVANGLREIFENWILQDRAKERIKY